MQTKWIKVAMFTVPLLIAGSIYTFAAAGTEEADQAQDSGSGITYRLVKSEPLTPEELKQLETAKMTASDPDSSTTEPNQTVEQSVLDAHNPFLVYAPTTTGAGTSDTGTGGGTAGSTTQPSQAQPSPNAKFDLALVKKLELKTNTDHGWLKLKFENKDGKLKIAGQLATRKFELEGVRAHDMMNNLLGSFGLNNAITAALQGKNVSLDATTLQALSDLKIELADGRKIEANTHAPKAGAGNNNGLHKGHDKHDDKKDKKNGKDKSKGKGHDNDDDGDDGDDD